MTFIGITATAGLLALAALPAAAATVTLGFGGTVADVERAPYREAGVTFTVVTGHYDIFGNTHASAFNVDNAFTGPVRIDITSDGGAFDLLGFDVIDAPPAGEAVFTSDLGDRFAVPSASGPVRFSASFRGVSTLTLTYDSFVQFAFDDFAIEDGRPAGPGAGGDGIPAGVPLPAGLPLLGAALGGLALAARRRRTGAARRD